jgi:hypothetical protein
MKRFLYNVIRVVGGMLAPWYAPPSYGEAQAEASVSTRADARRAARRVLSALGLVIVALVVLVEVLLGW